MLAILSDDPSFYQSKIILKVLVWCNAVVSKREAVRKIFWNIWVIIQCLMTRIKNHLLHEGQTAVPGYSLICQERHLRRIAFRPKLSGIIDTDVFMN